MILMVKKKEGFLALFGFDEFYIILGWRQK